MSVDRAEERTADTSQAVTTQAVTTEAVTTTALRYYSVAPGVRLNVRSGPGTSYSIVRVLPAGARVS
jgi:uncharacterized protein YraI